MPLRAYRTFQALILALLGIFLLNKIWSGTLYWYINARFLPLTLFGGLAFLGLAQVMLSARREREEDPESVGDPRDPLPHGHESGSSQWRALVILIVPVALGLLLPARPLGSAAVANRGLTFQAPLSAGGESSLLHLERAPTERTVLDWIRVFNLQEDRSRFEGQPADVIGFVYHDPRLAEGQFLLGRFTLTCCVADAAAIALQVVWPQAGTLPANTWVRVRGPIFVGELEGEIIPRIEAEAVEAIEPPGEPYLYN